MKKATLRDLTFLLGITLLIFYPLFYTHYFYTDEIGQLRNYRPGSHYHMFVELGRSITDYLFQILFNSIGTISQITRLRLFSLFGWMSCIPIWYLILKYVCRQEQLPRILPFFTVLYLVCCPPFCMQVSWASCMEHFLANTTGLLAGYFLYSHLHGNSIHGNFRGKSLSGNIHGNSLSGNIPQKTNFSLVPWAGALLFGTVSLFTYQNGYGCFLLPFLLHVIRERKWTRTLGLALGCYLLTYLLYYGLFRWQMSWWHIDSSERSGFSLSPINKIAFFLARPLAAAFRFTWIAREDRPIANYIPQFLLLAWITTNLYVHRFVSLTRRLGYLAGIGCLLALVYLPSLVAKENYASNRTLLGLELATFLLVLSTLLQVLRTETHGLWASVLLGVFLVISASYNFRYQFLNPVKKEYDLVRNYIERGYHSGISSIVFIRPPQQLFHDRFGVETSWDEFGIPSTFPAWVPEDFVRQVILEKTGRSATADSLQIVNLPLATTYPLPATSQTSTSSLIIDVEKIMR